jgi:protein TonB
MKNQEPITAQMDEIVFEYRNKNYGAYILRKMYNKQIVRALFLSSAVMIAGLAYPLVLSYNATKGAIHIIDKGEVELMKLKKPPVDLPEIPKTQQQNSEIPKRLVFVAPNIVEGEVPDDVDIFNMDDRNKYNNFVPVDVSEEPVAVKKEEVIEIKAEEILQIFVEEMPSYRGGDAERQKFLADNIKYPPQAIETGIQGTVYVQFIVDSKGNITDVKMLRGIGGGCDDEAVRIVKMMPQWNPGKQNGKMVRVLFTMPVVFKLQS